MQDRFKFRIALHQDKYEEYGLEEFKNQRIFEVKSLNIGYENSTVEIIAEYPNGDWAVSEIDIEDVVLMQCTGLKDKNGKLIYEGDILKINTHFNHLVSDDFNYKYENEKGYSLFKVIYNDKFARFEVERIKWVKFETEHTRLSYIPTNHSIIGNIYENKELLEE